MLVKEIDSYYGTALDSERGLPGVPVQPVRQGPRVASTAGAKKQIAKAAAGHHHKGDKPAVVFDIDDTLLLSLDYEKKTNYVYNDATWKEYVAKANRPAVFGSPELVAYAQ